MAYLGIDQALGRTGVAVVDDKGEVLHLSVVAPPRGLIGVGRLAYIRESLRKIIEKYDIKQGALEGYAYEATGRTFDLGEVGGVVRLLLHDLCIPFLVVAPAALKKFVAGNAQASKELMRKATQKKWGIDIDEDNMCDAYGLARVAEVSDRAASTTNRDELEVLQKIRDSRSTQSFGKLSKPAKSKFKLSI